LEHVDPQQPVAEVLVVGPEYGCGVRRTEGTDLPARRAVQRVADTAQVADLRRGLQAFVPVDESVLAVAAVPTVGRLVERVDQPAARGQYLAAGSVDGGVGRRSLPAQPAIGLVELVAL